MERDRDGGGRLLHRRDPQPRPRREDRDEPRGRVRPFVYTLILSPSYLARYRRRSESASLVDPKTIFVHFASKSVRRARRGSNVLNSADHDHADPGVDPVGLNAITGTADRCARWPRTASSRFFQHVNHHSVPDRAILFNVACSIAVVFLGGAVEIYTFSNVGYLASFIPVLDRLLPVAQVPATCTQAVQAARVDEVDSPVDRRLSTPSSLLPAPVREAARATPRDGRRCRTTSSASASCCCTSRYGRTESTSRTNACRRRRRRPRYPRRSREPPSREHRGRDGRARVDRAGSVRADPARV